MEFSLSPGYHDLFSEKSGDPQRFISEYHSEGVLLYLSFLNAQVSLNDEESPEFQSNLVNKLTTFWPENQKLLFNNTIQQHLSKHKTAMNLFKSIYITFFISRELIHFRRQGHQVDSLGEYKVIMAYLGYIDEFNKIFTSSLAQSQPEASDQLRFQKLHWPFLIQQFDFNEPVDPLYQSICTGLLLDHFFLDTKYHHHIRSYLEFYKRTAVWGFVFDYVELIKISFQKSEKFDVNLFAIQSSDNFLSMLDNLSIDIEDYQNDKTLHQDNLGIKKKPLLKSSQGFYIVLNWKFLYKSIYIGTAFDFMKKSNLSYNSFKSIVGFEVIEKRFFRSLFSYMFETYNTVLEFSDNDGMPDCYLRLGKYIFLIEVKDYLVSTETISSGSFEKISNHLNLNFVKNEKGKNKGISQLANQISHLDKECYSFDNYIQKGIKKRNIVLIPIIITTAFTYQMPGINKYLSDLMSEKLTVNSFGSIYPLTMIDFKFFYRQFMRIRSKQVDLKDLIKQYQARLKNAQKEFKKNPSLKNGFIVNSAFEESLTNNIRLHGTPQKEKDFTKGLFDALRVMPENTTLVETR
jgi:hypothetical protein